MLVLTRKMYEGFVVEVEGKEVEIYMVEGKSGKPRVGIQCDSDVKINRMELFPEEKQKTFKFYKEKK